MNIVLLAENEIDGPLPLDDIRSVHILEVLKLGEGDLFDVGLLDGPRGKAKITAIGRRGIELECTFSSDIPRLYDVSMLIGLPRPPSARRILRDLTAQGVGDLQFVVTEKGEKSYLNSRLWSHGEYKRLLSEGAAQAFCTRLPNVAVHSSLGECLEGLEGQTDRLALDNYESSLPLGSYRPCHRSTVIAVGAERGWSAIERDLLRAHDFTLVNVGQRVLRTETAAIAALAIVLAQRGLV
jgi:16S rRNA (uracil1498-N3)-methyltransferase